MKRTGTILDNIRDAMRSTQPIDNEKVARWVECLTPQKISQWRALVKTKSDNDRKNAGNRTSAISGSTPPELEDLSKLFDD